MTSCKICKKRIHKIMIQVYTCKCSKVYCSEHLHQHDCSFDHGKLHSEILAKKLPVVKKKKIKNI